MPNSNVRDFVINSLNKFNSYLNTNILSSYAEGSYVYNAYSYILNAIYDNEYVTAYGLIQLNEKINNLDGLDLSEYALKTTLNSYITYANAKKFYPTYAYVYNNYTSYAYLDERLSNIDLSNYVEKSDLTNQSYITKTDLTNQSYVTSSDLNNYVTQQTLSSQSYAGYSYVYDAYAYIIDSIIDNEYVISSTLNEHYNKIQNLENAGYLTISSLDSMSYAGYTYVYDAYTYIMTKIHILELSGGSGSGSGAGGNGGIDAIILNGSPVEITNGIAVINTTAVNDSTITIKMNNSTVDTFTVNAAANKEINLGTVLTSHQSLTDYVTKTELNNAGYITSGLPSVTSSDNGKILMVVNGAWQLISPSTIYSGNASPSNANGNNGDIYIQS